LNNVTITKNSAATGDGGGINNWFGTVNLRNTIIAGNIDPGGQAPDCSGGPNSLGYNLIGDSNGCAFPTTTGDQVGSPGVPLNPKLGSLANNAGPTKTHALFVTSPAINGGDDTTCLATDQRGVTRSGVGAHCDIGVRGTVYPLHLPLIIK
jgi:hypothetical protein